MHQKGVCFGALQSAGVDSRSLFLFGDFGEVWGLCIVLLLVFESFHIKNLVLKGRDRLLCPDGETFGAFS